MRSLTFRFFAFIVALLTSAGLYAHDVTISGTQTFASLDGSSSDHDGLPNGVFTVSDGSLVVNGTVNCNDGVGAPLSPCPMTFNVSGNLTINAGAALYAEDRIAAGTPAGITLTVGGNLVLAGRTVAAPGAMISTAALAASTASGGNVSITAGGGVTMGSGSTIDTSSFQFNGGNISINAGAPLSIDGQILSGPSRALSPLPVGNVLIGAALTQRGGQISIASSTFVEPALVVGTNAVIVSQGETPGAGPVSLSACGIEVRGHVAVLGRAATSTTVAIRSGKNILVDARDLGVAGAAAGRTARLRADSTLLGTAANRYVDLFATGSVTILGPDPALSPRYAISSIGGAADPNVRGGNIRISALQGAVTASGRTANATQEFVGGQGGRVEISATGQANLTGADIRATGNFSVLTSGRKGGMIAVRSHSGEVVWVNGVGDVRPVGSTSGIPLADQGTINLTACGNVNTAGATFPTNGVATGVFPLVTPGSCVPSSPSLPPGAAPLVTCNTPPVANDAVASTNEDTTAAINLSGSDADGHSLTFSIVSGPSSGTLGAIVPTGPTTATVNYTPNVHYNGADSFVYQANDGNGGSDTATVTITVNAVNDPPTFLAGATVSVNEDAGSQTIANWVSNISAGPADESAQTVTFTVTNNNASLFTVQPAVSPAGSLTFAPAPNAHGSASITIVASDNGGTANGGRDTSSPQTSSITLIAVNDEPSFTSGANQAVNEDAGAQTVANWASGISPGANESGQTVSFVLTNSNNALFSSQPAVSSNGTLTYTAAANANGTATVTIFAKDNGGTANGGDDSSPSQSFVITVSAVNDEPSFTAGGNVAVNEDSTAYAATWATNVSAGPADENGQTVTFTVSNSQNTLFASQPAISPSGTLTFTPAANAFGSATVTVTLSDNGGTANSGDDTSSAQTFVLTVHAVNDEPTFTGGGNITANEDSGNYSAAWATAISAGPKESAQALTFQVSADNNALFASLPSISPSGVLNFRPAANANGTAIVTVIVSDDGGTANGGDDTSPAQSFTINISAVNDAPSFVSGGNVTVSEDSGAYSAQWAANITAGPADENAQTLTFHITSNSNPALFASGPVISPGGVLSFTPAPNAFGSAILMVTLSDSGGTAGGGADTSAPQTLTIHMSAVNDEPTFTRGGNVGVYEDSGNYSATWATAVSAGPNEGSQALQFVVSSDNSTLFSSQPAISSTGVLTFRPAANANGSATVSVHLRDDGGTANGGDDTSSTVTFTIQVVAVNDAPAFAGSGNIALQEDSAAYSAQWATGINAGPADESGQTLAFTITGNTNAALFAAGPSISATGVLSFALATNAFGSATITVVLADNGGTANGGVDTSAPQTFTITVSTVNDAPSFTPGGNVTVAEDSGPYAAAWATSISPGQNESGQTVTFVTSNTNNALFSAQPSISSNGVLTFTPAPNAFGSASVSAFARDNGGTANGGVDTSVTVTFTITISAVNDPPSATHDSWETLGNTELRVDLAAGSSPNVSDTTASGRGVLDNDRDLLEGHAMAITGVVGCPDTTAPFVCVLPGGSLTLQANGAFSFHPNAWATTASFQYTLTDQPPAGTPASATATVTISIHDMIWYVNGSALAGGDGTSDGPFRDLAPLSGPSDVDSPGDYIFVQHSNVTGSIELEAAQRLWGEGVGLVIQRNLNGNGLPATVVPPGARPNLTSAGDVVVVAGVAGVEVAGLNITSTGGSGVDVTSLAAHPLVTALIRSNGIVASGSEGIDINAGSSAGMSVSVNGTDVTALGNGVDISARAGRLLFSFANGTVSSTSASGIFAEGSAAATLIVTGLNNVTIRGTTAGDGVSMSSARFDANPDTAAFEAVSTGTLAIGSALDPVGGVAFRLLAASGDLAFGSLAAHGTTGGLAVQGAGLFTGAAGLRITSAGGSLSAASGPGLTVANTSIGAAHLVFDSVSAIGGLNGILLSNTGLAGSLRVIGGDASASGGTIRNTTGDGISLANTLNPAFGRMNVSGTGGHGVSAADVNGLTLKECVIANSGNAAREHGLSLRNVTGTISIDGTTFDNAAQDLLNLQNHNLDATLSVVNASTFSFPAAVAPTAGAAISIAPSGSSAVTATITGSSFSNVVGDAVRFATGGTGSSSLTMSNNTLAVTMAGRASSIAMSGHDSARTTISISHNNFSGAGGNGVIGVDANDASQVRGAIRANAIANAAATGISTSVDEASTARLIIDGNTITNSGSDGIQASHFGGPGVSEMSVAVTNNTINGSNRNPAAAFVGGIALFGFEDSSCIALTGNQVINTPVSPTACGGAPCADYYIQESGGAMQWEENPDTPATTLTAAHVQATNNAAANVAIFGTIDLSNGAACTRP